MMHYFHNQGFLGYLGMHYFQGNIWDGESKPQVMQLLGYPLRTTDRIPKITEARNFELGLGLQMVSSQSPDGQLSGREESWDSC